MNFLPGVTLSQALNEHLHLDSQEVRNFASHIETISLDVYHAKNKKKNEKKLKKNFIFIFKIGSINKEISSITCMY